MQEKLKSRKLQFTVVSLIVHLIVLVVLWLTDKVDASTLGIWFGSWNITIAVYTGANVWQKKVTQSHPEI